MRVGSLAQRSQLPAFERETPRRARRRRRGAAAVLAAAAEAMEREGSRGAVRERDLNRDCPHRPPETRARDG